MASLMKLHRSVLLLAVNIFVLQVFLFLLF